MSLGTLSVRGDEDRKMRVPGDQCLEATGSSRSSAGEIRGAWDTCCKPPAQGACAVTEGHEWFSGPSQMCCSVFVAHVASSAKPTGQTRPLT